MATTYFKAVHRTNSGSIAAALKNTINYAKNPEKTNDGILVIGYECTPELAASEFSLSKAKYEQITGRNQGKNDVVGYQMRQSFAPGEVTPEEALEIGRDTAMRFTKGQHQFVVAVHTNTNCVHSHIFFNFVALDYTRKFKDFKLSALALRKISDHICAEHGLSVIENPGLSKGRDYAKYMKERKPPTARDKLRELIDEKLVVGNQFGDFLFKLKQAGCEIKIAKHTAIKLLGSKKFIRFDSLGDDYIEAAIHERLSGSRDVISKGKLSEKSQKNVAKTQTISGTVQTDSLKTQTSDVPNLMIDIQAKIRQGYGAGYEQWAKIFNLRQAAKTLIFLQENNIDSYDDLKAKSSAVSNEFSRLSDEIRGIEKHQKEVTELQKQIGTYIKTRDAYKKYMSIKNQRSRNEFYEANRADIVLHQMAKKYFDDNNYKGKLPSINALKQEWATLESDKKQLYKKYHAIKPKHKELQTALLNADNLLRRQRQQHQKQKTYDYGAR